MIKTLTSTALLAAIGSVGLASSASAAILNTGDQISFNINAFQVNAAGLPPIAVSGPPGTPLSPPFSPVGLSYGLAPAPTPSGGANGAFDTIFGTYASPLSPDPLTNTVRVSDNCYSTILGGIAVAGSPGSGGGLICANGNYGQVQAGPGSGGFDLIGVNSFGGILNFDTSNPDLTTLGPALRINANVTAPTDDYFVFTLSSFQTTAYLPLVAPGDPQLEVSFFDDTNIPGRLLFTALGSVQYVIGGVVQETRQVKLDYVGTGIRDDGLGGDFVNGDGITGRSTQAFSIEVLASESVPEPSTLAFLGTAAFMGLGAKFLKKK